MFHPRIQDNNSIYYEPVPDLDMLDPLPQPVMMMKPLPSVEEAPPTGILSFRATGSGSGDESGAGGGGGDKVAGAGKCPDKTDEELARDLHKQLNT